LLVTHNQPKRLRGPWRLSCPEISAISVARRPEFRITRLGAEKSVSSRGARLEWRKFRLVWRKFGLSIRGEKVLRRIQLLRVNDRVLAEAGRMEPAELRSLDAIHLASTRHLGPAVKRIVTYDERVAQAARANGWSVAAPT
jgi:hypothetical protein